jgi:hypothetical protein
MPSTKINLLLEQGATFHYETTLNDANSEPLSVTGFSADAQMRKHFESNTAYSFDLTLADGLLTMDMANTVTATIEPGRYVYDVYFSDSNTVSRVLEGIVTVTGQVTR